MKIMIRESYVAPQYMVDCINANGLAHAVVSLNVLPDNKIVAVFRVNIYQEESLVMCLPC